MCLILFAYNHHPDFRLILAANRDEFYERPAAPLGYWEDHPHVLAGRDLRQSGTWMGVSRHGKFAAITNYRQPDRQAQDAPSRGHLVADYLIGDRSAADYTDGLIAGQYNGFNLLVGDPSGLYYLSNRGGPPTAVPSGVHGLSNRLLDSPWPKVTSGKTKLASIVQNNTDNCLNELLMVMQTQVEAPDDQLPDTGVGYALEKMLSPIFITSIDYGTRCTTLLTIDRKGRMTMIEYTWVPGQPSPALQSKSEFVIP